MSKKQDLIVYDDRRQPWFYCWICKYFFYQIFWKISKHSIYKHHHICSRNRNYFTWLRKSMLKLIFLHLFVLMKSMSYYIYAVDQTICKNKKRKCFISLKETKSKFYRSDTDSSTATKTAVESNNIYKGSAAKCSK